MIDWLPLKNLKEMRRIVGVMDKTSRTIYSAKITSLTEPNPTTVVDGKGDLGPRAKGKDIMTVLRMSHYCKNGDCDTDVITVKANASASASDKLTEEELLGQMKPV